MSYKLVAYGDVNDLISLENYQSSFNEGDRGYLDLHLASASSDLVSLAANGLNSHLLNKIEGYSLEVSPSLLRIRFKVAIPPLVIIALAIAAIVVLLGLILAWKLYKLSPVGVVTSVAVIVFVVALAAVAAVVLIIAMRKVLT